MKRKVELPLVEPIVSTYHGQAHGAAAIYGNPSIRNWYLNHSVNLCCTRRFLLGYTSPELIIGGTTWFENPYLERIFYHMQFAKGHINPIIRELLDNGYYVCFNGVDDYYVEGKSWYREKHFSHDGMICGYDQEKKTYSILAYDSNWVCRKFAISQKSFNEGRKACFRQGDYGAICGIKPKSDSVEFKPDTVIKELREYMDSSLEKYPTTEEGMAFGIAVHDYVVLYLDKLMDSSIPYERMDRRVFRLIWEHKKMMLERLIKMEEVLHLDARTSNAYEPLVTEADSMRVLYASHHKKRRDSLLPIIKKKLIDLKDKEHDILTEFIERAGGVLEK